MFHDSRIIVRTGLLLCCCWMLMSCRSPEAVETLTAEQAAAQYQDPVPGHFVTVEGARIYYLDSGMPGSVAPESIAAASDTHANSPILLIHGLGASTFSFRRNTPELARGRRVVAVDLKGFGFSKEFSDMDFSFAGEARTVVALMDALKISRATLVGQSLGGTIAAMIAAQHPERVDRLILIDSATLYITRPFATRLLHGHMFNSMAYLVGGPHRGRVRRLLEKAYADPSKVTKDDVEGYYFPFTIKNSAKALQLFLTTNNPNGNALLARIQAPTLILWGAEDSFIDLSVRDFLHQQIRNSQVVVIEKAGHAVMEEKPEEVNRAIVRFLLEGR